jgi:hypothetical protein
MKVQEHRSYGRQPRLTVSAARGFLELVRREVGREVGPQRDNRAGA